MRRLITMAGLLIIGACTSETAPSEVQDVVMDFNSSSNGVFVGDQVQVDANPLDANGSAVAVAVTYASSNTGVATVSATGLITAISAGTTNISATAAGTVATLPLTVDGNVSFGVQVTPAQATVKTGGQQLFTALVTTTLGNPARGKIVNWTSSIPASVSVNTSGNATGLSPTAAASICASATDVGGVVGCATLTVTP
jgi:uncharacterized protein YjdB